MSRALFVVWIALTMLMYSHAQGIATVDTLYLVRTLFFTAFAVMGLLLLVQRRKASKTFLTALLLSAIYSVGFGIYGGDYFYGASFIAFILGCYYLAEKRVLSTRLLPISLIVGIVSVFLLDLSTGGDYIYTAYYGRQRLQLGFTHPKEIGNMILVLVLWLQIWGRVDKRTNAIIIFFVVILLWFVDSRNALLTMVVFLISQRTTKATGSTGLSLMTLTAVFASVFAVVLFFDEVSSLSSGRISWWADILSGIAEPTMRTTAFQSMAPKLDNYWLEVYYVLPSLLSLGAFATLMMLVFQAKKRSHHIVYALILAQVFNSFWDSGFMSVGSLLNVFVWVAILMYAKRDEQV